MGGGSHFTRGRVLSSSPHWWALYFFTSAMYFAHASPLLVNTCGGGGAQEVGKGMPGRPGTGIRTVLRQLTHPQCHPRGRRFEVKIFRVKLSGVLVESPPPPPSTHIQGPEARQGGTGLISQVLRLEKKGHLGSPPHTTCSPHPPSSASWLLFPS